MMIPSKSSRKLQHQIDGKLYWVRNRIERFFNKLKYSRRIATRYDQPLFSFLAFVQIATIGLWIRFVRRTMPLYRL